MQHKQFNFFPQPERSQMRVKPLLALAFATAFISGGAAAADKQLIGGTPTPTPAPTAPAPAAASSALPGVQVAIDPATGRLRAPTAADQAALASVAQMAPEANNPISRMPKDEAAALATLRVNPAKGIEASIQIAQTQISSISARVNADGSITMYEGDEPATKSQGETE
jgi:hypothetical protein